MAFMRGAALASGDFYPPRKAMRRRRAEALGTLNKIVFALVAPIVFCALAATAAELIACDPAWLLALISGDLTKREHKAWDSLSFEEQQ